MLPALGVPRKISPIIVARIVAPHFLPVKDTRIAKKAGSKKKRSSYLVTVRSSILDTYPYAVKSAVSTATKPMYRLVDIPLSPGKLAPPIHDWLMRLHGTCRYLGFDSWQYAQILNHGEALS